MNLFRSCSPIFRAKFLLGVIGVAVLLVLGLGWRYGLPAWREWRAGKFEAQCRKLRDKHDWLKLAALAERWAKSDPQHSNAWLYLAEAAQQRGDFSAAAEYLTKIPEADPKALPALVTLSALQFGPLNRPLDGVQTCERILKAEPRTGPAHDRLIEFYAMTLQREKLIRQIRYAIEMSREPPSAYIYLFLVDSMRLANGVELNLKWQRTYPDREEFQVAAALQLPEPEVGVDQPAHDKHSKIAALFHRYPQNLELLAYQTDFAIREGNTRDLTELLKRVPSAADGDDRFWRAKGWLHLNRNESDKARRALERALRLYPLDWNARSWLADVERREGNLEAADRLQNLVRQARRLREEITNRHDITNIPTETLAELVVYSRDCGETQVATALGARLKGLQ